MVESASLLCRPGELRDLDALLRLENLSFAHDRMSRRSLRHWLQAAHGLLWVASSSENPETLLGYGLVILQRGTRLARLYSLAVDAAARGRGVGGLLLDRLETEAAERGRWEMRLEVAQDNVAAQALYRKRGYVSFEVWQDYYEDHSAALRMRKRIRFPEAPDAGFPNAPWYPQSTDFTCGPASLLMALQALDPERVCTLEEELAVWREATSIFMMSGHGGCHPLGLGLAAKCRGVEAEVWCNLQGPLFLEGVRGKNEKEILRRVHAEFLRQAGEAGMRIHRQPLRLNTLEEVMRKGAAVLVMISTYRLNRRKVPHWVLVTAVDRECLYVHDPDPDPGQLPVDCQHVPIAREAFDAMVCYGGNRLRTAVVLYPQAQSG